MNCAYFLHHQSRNTSNALTNGFRTSCIDVVAVHVATAQRKHCGLAYAFLIKEELPRLTVIIQHGSSVDPITYGAEEALDISDIMRGAGATSSLYHNISVLPAAARTGLKFQSSSLNFHIQFLWATVERFAMQKVDGPHL